MNRFFLFLLFLLSGCLATSIVDKPAVDAKYKSQSISIEKAILETAKTGDWLVIRGYHGTDNLVTNATGIPLSHVAVFDFKTKEVIEAEGIGVHKTSLTDFIDKSFRVLVIRPRWWNEVNADSAYSNAEKLVGSDYDYLGTIGFSFPSKYYCSELAVTIYKPWFRNKENFPEVIKPGELYLYGSVLYDSLPRDEM